MLLEHTTDWYIDFNQVYYEALELLIFAKDIEVFMEWLKCMKSIVKQTSFRNVSWMRTYCNCIEELIFAYWKFPYYIPVCAIISNGDSYPEVALDLTVFGMDVNDEEKLLRNSNMQSFNGDVVSMYKFVTTRYGVRDDSQISLFHCLAFMSMDVRTYTEIRLYLLMILSCLDSEEFMSSGILHIESLLEYHPRLFGDLMDLFEFCKNQEQYHNMFLSVIGCIKYLVGKQSFREQMEDLSVFTLTGPLFSTIRDFLSDLEDLKFEHPGYPPKAIAFGELLKIVPEMLCDINVFDHDDSDGLRLNTQGFCQFLLKIVSTTCAKIPHVAVSALSALQWLFPKTLMYFHAELKGLNVLMVSFLKFLSLPVSCVPVYVDQVCLESFPNVLRGLICEVFLRNLTLAVARYHNDILDLDIETLIACMERLWIPSPEGTKGLRRTVLSVSWKFLSTLVHNQPHILPRLCENGVVRLFIVHCTIESCESFEEIVAYVELLKAVCLYDQGLDVIRKSMILQRCIRVFVSKEHCDIVGKRPAMLSKSLQDWVRQHNVLLADFCKFIKLALQEYPFIVNGEDMVGLHNVCVLLSHFLARTDFQRVLDECDEFVSDFLACVLLKAGNLGAVRSESATVDSIPRQSLEHQSRIAVASGNCFVHLLHSVKFMEYFLSCLADNLNESRRAIFENFDASGPVFEALDFLCMMFPRLKNRWSALRVCKNFDRFFEELANLVVLRMHFPMIETHQQHLLKMCEIFGKYDLYDERERPLLSKLLCQMFSWKNVGVRSMQWESHDISNVLKYMRNVFEFTDGVRLKFLRSTRDYSEKMMSHLIEDPCGMRKVFEIFRFFAEMLLHGRYTDKNPWGLNLHEDLRSCKSRRGIQDRDASARRSLSPSRFRPELQELLMQLGGSIVGFTSQEFLANSFLWARLCTSQVVRSWDMLKSAEINRTHKHDLRMSDVLVQAAGTLFMQMSKLSKSERFGEREHDDDSISPEILSEMVKVFNAQDTGGIDFNSTKVFELFQGLIRCCFHNACAGKQYVDTLNVMNDICTSTTEDVIRDSFMKNVLAFAKDEVHIHRKDGNHNAGFRFESINVLSDVLAKIVFASRIWRIDSVSNLVELLFDSFDFLEAAISFSDTVQPNVGDSVVTVMKCVLAGLRSDNDAVLAAENPLLLFTASRKRRVVDFCLFLLQSSLRHVCAILELLAVTMEDYELVEYFYNTRGLESLLRLSTSDDPRKAGELCTTIIKQLFESPENLQYRFEQEICKFMVTTPSSGIQYDHFVSFFHSILRRSPKLFFNSVVQLCQVERGLFVIRLKGKPIIQEILEHGGRQPVVLPQIEAYLATIKEYLMNYLDTERFVIGAASIAESLVKVMKSYSSYMSGFLDARFITFVCEKVLAKKFPRKLKEQCVILLTLALHTHDAASVLIQHLLTGLENGVKVYADVIILLLSIKPKRWWISKFLLNYGVVGLLQRLIIKFAGVDCPKQALMLERMFSILCHICKADSEIQLSTELSWKSDCDRLVFDELIFQEFLEEEDEDEFELRRRGIVLVDAEDFDSAAVGDRDVYDHEFVPRRLRLSSFHQTRTEEWFHASLRGMAGEAHQSPLQQYLDARISSESVESIEESGYFQLSNVDREASNPNSNRVDEHDEDEDGSEDFSMGSHVEDFSVGSNLEDISVARSEGSNADGIFSHLVAMNNDNQEMPESYDEEFLAALPDDMVLEILGHRNRAPPVVHPHAGLDRETEIACNLAMYDDELRREVLINMGDEDLCFLPSSILAEAVVDRHRHFGSPEEEFFEDQDDDEPDESEQGDHSHEDAAGDIHVVELRDFDQDSLIPTSFVPTLVEIYAFRVHMQGEFLRDLLVAMCSYKVNREMIVDSVVRNLKHTVDDGSHFAGGFKRLMDLLAILCSSCVDEAYVLLFVKEPALFRIVFSCVSLSVLTESPVNLKTFCVAVHKLLVTHELKQSVGIDNSCVEICENDLKAFIEVVSRPFFPERLVVPCHAILKILCSWYRGLILTCVSHVLEISLSSETVQGSTSAQWTCIYRCISVLSAVGESRELANNVLLSNVFSLFKSTLDAKLHSLELDVAESGFQDNLRLIVPLLMSYFEFYGPHISGPDDWHLESNASLMAFCATHKRLLNYVCELHPKMLRGSLKMLLWHPGKILDFNVKKRYFDELLGVDRSKQRRNAKIKLLIRREKIFPDSYHQIKSFNLDTLKHTIMVKFLKEDGVDAGGLTREWYLELSREIFNPNYALFQQAANNGSVFQPNRNSFYNPEHLEYFKFVGRFVGKAIYDGCLLDAYFTRSFYKHMLSVAPSYHDIESIDPDYYRNLKWMLENNIDGVLDLTFSAEMDQLGHRQIIDLVPEGRKIRVTNDNKFEYVKLITDLKMTKEISNQIHAFNEGFHELIPLDLISVFNEQELELLICGLPELDVSDLRMNTEYRGYQASSTVIQWFWKILAELSQREKAMFLQFVTGTSKIPVHGFARLMGMCGIQKFQIHRAHNVNCLPSSHTCFNQLDLPEYESMEILRSKLLLAISECTSGFQLV